MSSTTVANNFSPGLVAAGTTQGTATVLPALSFYNQVATCTGAASGVKLPEWHVLCLMQKCIGVGPTQDSPCVSSTVSPLIFWWC